LRTLARARTRDDRDQLRLVTQAARTLGLHYEQSAEETEATLKLRDTLGAATVDLLQVRRG